MPLAVNESGRPFQDSELDLNGCAGASFICYRYSERLTPRRAFCRFSSCRQMLNLCTSLKRRKRSGSWMIGQARKALQRIEMVRKSPLRRAFCRPGEAKQAVILPSTHPRPSLQLGAPRSLRGIYIGNLLGSLARRVARCQGRPIFRPYEAWSKQYVPNIDVVFAANGGLVGQLDSSDSF